MLTVSTSSWANGKAFLDLEDNQIISVFSQPGMNWKSCQKSSNCRSLGWPDNTAQIEVVSSPVKMKVPDLYSDKMVEEEYVKIKYKYKRTVDGKVYSQEGEGWVDAAYVSKRKNKTFFGPATAKKDNCPPGSKKNNNPAAEIAKNLEPLTESLSHSTVLGAVEQVRGKVGACVIDPQKPPARYAEGNPFDNYVLGNLQKQSVPKVLKEDNTPMTQKDLVTIDALARTLYAEMARCYKHGLHYPMSVAKIVMNRAETPSRHKEFIKGTHASEKSPMAKAATSPSQFSLWLKTIDGKPNNSLPQALCPPADKTKNFWRGSKPPSFETDIWENTLRIATESVLYPKQFAARTKGVTQFFYTSGMNGFFKMKQVYPSIEDRKVSKDACMQIWDDGSSRR